jgi:hypothetical protein
MHLKKLVIVAALLSPVLYFIHPTNEYTPINRLMILFRSYQPAIIDIDNLLPSLSVSEITSMHSELNLYCAREVTELASESCYNHVTSINGEEAWHVAFFFKKKKLVFVKMDFLENGHKAVINKINSKYGSPQDIVKSKHDIPLVKWILKEGVLTTNSSAYAGDITQVLWISTSELLQMWLRQKIMKHDDKEQTTAN